MFIVLVFSTIDFMTSCSGPPSILRQALDTKSTVRVTCRGEAYSGVVQCFDKHLNLILTEVVWHYALTDTVCVTKAYPAKPGKRRRKRTKKKRVTKMQSMKIPRIFLRGENIVFINLLK